MVPYLPWQSASLQAGTSEATTRHPEASASINTVPNPSWGVVLKTNTFDVLKRSGTSVLLPRNRTEVSFNSLHNPGSRSFNDPNPTTDSFRSLPLPSMIFQARNNVT